MRKTLENTGKSDHQTGRSNRTYRRRRKDHRCKTVFRSHLSLSGSCTLYRNIPESKMHLRRCQQLYRPKWSAGSQLSDGFPEKSGNRNVSFQDRNTSAELTGNTIDYSARWKNSLVTRELCRFPLQRIRNRYRLPQKSCWLTYTNEKTHEIIRNNLDRSPLYSGMIEGTGPRYCPSIEDKVVRFADKNRHQVFIEPEGLYTNEMYIGGMSSSLPEDVQDAMYHSVPGLEHAKIVKNAYAIEYDCINPRQLVSDTGI